MRDRFRSACLGFAVLAMSVLTAAADLPEWKQALQPENDDWRQTEQHYIFNNGAEPETLDPALSTGVPEARLIDTLFEGLVSLDPRNLTPRPGLAHSWDISEDQLVYTFHLRQNLRWSNGEPLTAQDVHDSWQRALLPSTGAAYAYMLYPIKGAKAFHQSELQDFGQVGVDVVDPLTLKVTLAHNCHYFLELAAFHTLYPVPLKVIEAHGDRWIRPEHIVTSGPFVVESWEPRQRIVMAKSPTYWDRSFVKLEKVTALPYDNLDTAYRLFQQGRLHWMDGIPLPKFEEVRRNPDYYVTPFLASYFYRFNTNKPPFDDKRVRLAFSLATDRAVITDEVLGAGQKPAAHLVPQMGTYHPPRGLSYDPERARQLIAEAGYGPDGPKTWPSVEILYNTSEAHKKVAEALAQMWQTNLGVTVSLRNAEWKVYLSEMDNFNYQVARASWVGDYTDPNTFLELFRTDGGNNRTGWSSQRYDELLLAAQREPDETRRNGIYKQLETLLVEEESPVLPLYIYVTQGLLSENVWGWYPNLRDLHSPKYIWLED